MATQYPKTPQELFASQWVAKIRSIIAGFRLNEPVEDTLGDVFYFMTKRDYLSKWDPKLGGSYPTYIFTFVVNICKNKWRRSHTEGGLAIECAKILETSPSDKASDTSGVVYEDRVVGTTFPATSTTSEYESLVDSIIKLLERKRYREHSYGTWNGEKIPRSMLQVFKYIEQEDLSVKEIAERFQTSLEFVYSLLTKMQKVIKESHISKTYNLEAYGTKR